MPHAYPPESAFGLQTVLLPDMLGCSAFSLTAGSVTLNFLLKYLVWVGPTASAWVCCRSVYRWIPHTVVAGEALEKGSAHRTQPRGAAQGSRLLPPVSGSMKCPTWHVTPSPGPVSLVFSPSQPRGRVRRSLGHHRGGEGW